MAETINDLPPIRRPQVEEERDALCARQRRITKWVLKKDKRRVEFLEFLNLPMGIIVVSSTGAVE
jgi:hypothetical protein